jgi:hypothetical protein
VSACASKFKRLSRGATSAVKAKPDAVLLVVSAGGLLLP